ncbi:hypothetical protein CCP1ISM_60029 [Azospirillaceae bacterium]
MADKEDELGQIKEDVLYSGELNFEEIKNNPILQPILEANTIYKSMGLSIQRSLSEYVRLMAEIQDMINKNPTYSQTQIVSKLQELIMHSKNVIHSQDIQREIIKKAMNDMVVNNKNYYEPRERDLASQFKEGLEDLKSGRVRKIEQVEMEKEPDLQSYVKSEIKKVMSIPEVEEPEIDLSAPKKRGRPRKYPIKKEITEDELNDELVNI